MASLSLTQQEFMDLGERILKECSEYFFHHLDSEVIVPPMNSCNIQNEIASYECESIPEIGEGRALLNTLPDFFRQCYHVNGRSFGFVYPSGVPVAALADFIASVTNQNVMASFLTTAASAIERAVIHWLSESIGCSGFCGTMTSGASMSNLMGLAMARECKIPANQSGVGPEHHNVVFYASKSVHMSTPKAMSLLGLGRRCLHLLDSDDEYRLSAKIVAKAIAEDRLAGLKPVAIIASAGTTGTGTVDRLEELADLAESEGLWLHVDGAYGAFAAMVKPGLFKGLCRADSISLDGHKWLNMPVDCGCLLVHHREDAIRAFSYVVDYICSPAKQTHTDEKREEIATYEETIELSRRFRAFKIWFALRFHGMKAFRNVISKNLQQAQLLAKIINDHPDLELMAPVDLSVVCFRLTKINNAIIPAHLLDEFNCDLLNTITKRGRYYFSKVIIKGKFCIRACVINHLTTNEDILEVPREVLEAAQATKYIDIIIKNHN